MNEQESLELIARMIQNSKKNMELGSGNIFLLWGYLSAAMAAVVLFLVWQTGSLKWNWLWFAVPLLGWPLQTYLKKKTERRVLTYTDKVISTIWGMLSAAMGAAAVIYCGDADTAILILPVIILCAGIGSAITGAIVRDRWMKYSGEIAFFIGLFSFRGTEAADMAGWYYDCFVYMACFIVMFIIPGHRLNREARRLRQKEGE